MLTSDYYMRPVAIPQAILMHLQPAEKLQANLVAIRKNILRLHAGMPEVSVVIPAYNEARNILGTLSSLSASSTVRAVEIIVADNNSTDATAQLAAAAGATCITAREQGITPARNAGLSMASGKYILDADADTIYPPGWIDLMVTPLLEDTIALTYGRFAFIPEEGASRIFYTGYEYAADLSRWMNKIFRDEAMNVYGFNSAFRRLEGIPVGGFDHPPGSNEDGWLGVKLRDTFRKKLHLVNDPQALVWTSDRRIQARGGLLKSFIHRLRPQI